MRIGRPRLEESDGRLSYRVPVQSSLGIDELWFSVDRKHGDLVSDRSEAALLGLLLPAMQRGEDVQVEGPISSRFLYNLQGPFQFLLASEYDWLRAVRIDASEVVPQPARAAGVATGFSAGIDSFSVLADHHYGEPLPGYRLTHLLYNNVGSHGVAGDDVFAARYERLLPLTERLGLPFVAVDSNLAAFYDDQLGFKITYSLRNATVALALQAGIGRSLHAAGTILGKDSSKRPLRDIAFFDPILLPMLATDALDVVQAGGQYTRVQKTLRVAEIEDSYDILDVCVRNDRAGNCSWCRKCVRTLLTLEIAGLTDRYGGVFDLAAFRRGRRWRVPAILRKGIQNNHEIVELARERGYRFSLHEWTIALTRLDLLRAWAIGQASRIGSVGRWIRRRKVERSPLRGART